MNERTMCAAGRMTRGAGLLVMTGLLLSGCGSAVSSGTSEARAICRELHADLPTYSPLDTERTMSEGADYLMTFQGVCAGYL